MYFKRKNRYPAVLKIARIIFLTLAVYVLYFGTFFLGPDHSLERINIFPIWLPSGIILSATLAFGYRIWPSIFLGVFFTVNTILLGINSYTFWNTQFIAIFISLGETSEILLGYYLVNKLIGKPDLLNRASSFAKFVLIAFIISIISASVVSTSITFGGIHPWEGYSVIWLKWCISHINSFVIITPFILSWKSASFIKWSPIKVIETIILFSIIMLLTLAIFGGKFSSEIIFPSSYLLIPPLLWLIIKFSHREVAIVIILISGIGILFTYNGNGPFIEESYEASILSLQGYLLIISISTLLLYSAISERRETEKELRLYRDDLELLVEQRSKEIKQNNEKLRNEIAERINTEKKLRVLSEAVEQSPASVIITDKKGKIEYANPKFIKVKGYSKEEVIGKNPRIFKSGIHDAKFYKLMWKTILNGDIWEGEIYNKKKNGELFWELTLISPILNEQGEISRLVGIYEDITKQKEAEARIKKYLRRLSESELRLTELNLNKDKFFTIIAHDLKGPFTSLLGFSEFLVNDFEELTLSEIKSYSNNIYESTKNTYKLLENILEWANLQMNKIELDFKKFDIGDVAKKVISLYSESAKLKNVTLEMNFKSVFYVYGDENTISTVIRNLVSNAIKFCNNGDIVSLSCIERNEDIEITISDTGIGMDKDDLEKLFRIDVHHTSIGTANEHGTGLGLILCKELLVKNHGQIRVKSKQGEGTKFIFTLPKEPLESNNSSKV